LSLDVLTGFLPSVWQVSRIVPRVDNRGVIRRAVDLELSHPSVI